jgi:zinc protease
VRSEVTDPALTDLLAEIKQMRDVPVSTKDLDTARRAIVGSFALLLESPGAILNNYIDRYMYKLPVDYWDTYASKIEAVTAADIQRVAQKYWSTDRLQVVAVGDQAVVEPALKKLGAVKIFDADGKLIGGSQ